MNKEERSLFEEAVFKWWCGLQHDGGGLANLRHQSDIFGIQCVPCFYDLIKRIEESIPSLFKGSESFMISNMDMIACVAMVVCHVERDSKENIAKLMGKTIETGHTVSEVRFNKMIATNRDELPRELIRIMPMIDNVANVKKLASDIWGWDLETSYVKKNWLREYYSN